MPKFNRLTRPNSAFWAVIFWILSLSAIASHAKQPLDPFVAAGADDASLNAVCAPTPDHVWAVGDRGAIWATTDGGRKWTRQDSGTSANLYAVAFKSSTEGTAVGGLPGALSRTSRSVVLRTVNGGQTWSVMPSEGLPRFTGMRAIGNRLIAWGDYCPQRKTGIFYSLNDGQSWQAMESSISHVAALGADRSGSVVAVDRVGNAYSSQQGMQSFFTTSPHQPISFIEHVGSTWLAGGVDGQLLRTIDARSWSRVALPLSPQTQHVCQWRTVAEHQDHIWIAGTPGSIVLHSSDAGVNWEVQSTEQTLPVRSMVFADAQRGWAVGPLGSILATRDGGRTWYSQRRTATRAGLLAITASDSQLPWAALVATSWDDGVASKSLSLFAENLEQSADYRIESWKLNEALASQVGIVEHEAWLHPKPAIASQTDLSPLVDRLVVELLCWRPDVVLTDETGGQRLSLENRAAMAALTNAIERASTANMQSIAKELMLPAWKVTKLASVTEARSSQYTEHANRLMREPGLSIWDVLAPLGVAYDANSRPLPMRTIQQSQSTLASNTSLFGGIAPSQTSHRQINLRSLGNYQLIMGRVHRMTTVDNLVTLPPETPISEWQTQLDFVLRQLPPRELSPSLIRVINACSSPPFWPRRQVALERLTQLQPDSDTASYARLTLLQMAASDELQAWRRGVERELSSNHSVGSLRSDTTNALSRNASALTPFDTVPVSAQKLANVPANGTLDLSKSGAGSQVVTGAQLDGGSMVSVAAFSSPSNDGSSNTDKARALRDQQSDLFFKALDNCYKSDLHLSSLPQLELMREAMTRQRTGAPRGANASTALLETIVGMTALAGWPQVAKQELLLVKDRPEQLRWVAFAVATANRPVLDGILDEPMWSACPPMKLTQNKLSQNGQSAKVDSSSSATIRWSYDDRYLYIAIDSPRMERPALNRAPRLRKYDSDLDATDHIHLVLDTDRDYGSAVELGVSSEGETYDRCCELPQYNPQYSVAVPESPLQDRWIAEIAIRLSDLTTRNELTGQAWAVSAHRRTPFRATQSWSSMLSEQPSLQSAGLLLFVQPPEK